MDASHQWRLSAHMCRSRQDSVVVSKCCLGEDSQISHDVMRILHIQNNIFAQSTMLLTPKHAPPTAVCIRPENPVEQLQTLRKELRALKRKRKRLDITTTWTPIQSMKRLGVLILRLTNDPKWTIIYVKSWQARNFQRTLSLPGAITDVTVQAWSHALRDDTELETMMTDLAHPGRMRVDRFLMESIVFEDIVQQSAKDITVPSSIVVAKYLRTWSLRPRCPAIDAHIEKLRISAKARRVWGRAFRRRWGLAWGAREANHGIGPAELKRKVSCGMRGAVSAWGP